MNQVQSNLSYKGEVVLKLNVAGKVIQIKQHNEGTPYLMKIICQFLTGNFPGNAYLPQYIMLEVSDDGGTSYSDFLNSKQPLTAPNYDYTGGNWVASFTAVINYANLLEVITPDDPRLFRLTMKSGTSTADDVAHISVAAVDLSKISPGTNLILEWKMAVVNDTTEGE